jgi:2-alkyl-3-oxoalkanoate reductase
MEVLITGGNGFIGRHLVTALQQRGDAVRVLALPGEDASEMDGRGVAVFRGDVRAPETLMAPMRGADGVLHLAAMMDVWRPLADYRAVNVTGTANVCRAALAAGVRRLVHMSSSSVYGVGRGGLVTEEAPLRPFSDPYPVSKAEGDVAVQTMIRQQGLPAVIIRPDQIFGPGDALHFGAMADRLISGAGVIVGSGRNHVPFVYVADVVDALLLALDHPRATGRAYNVTNDQPLTQLELLTAIASEVGARPPRVHIPRAVLYTAGFAAERLAVLTRSHRRPPVTRLGVVFIGADTRHDISRARTELGFAPRVALREGIRRAAAWHLARRASSVPARARPDEDAA